MYQPGPFTRTLVACSLLAAGAAALAAGYETPPALQAADVLPPELQASATHRVEPAVVNDGFMNRYQLSSQFGSLTASSTPELRKRVAELAAVAKLDSLSKTEEFARHLTGGAERIVSGAEQLITNPLDTVAGAFSGVGRMLDNAGESVFGVGGGDEDQLKALIGFNEKKREYAVAFEVDVYSRNPILQKHLEDVAWAGFSGGITTTAASMAVSGGVGTALSVTSGAERLNRKDMSRPPVELRKSNHDDLVAMGVSDDVAELFLDNRSFTLTQQSLLVDALRGLGAEGRVEVVKLAVRSSSADIAEFRRRQVQMYAALHRRGPAFTRLLTVGQMTTAVDADGALAFALPVDHLVWTEGLDTLSRTALELARGEAPDGARHLWVGGTLSATALGALVAQGWTVHAGATQALLGGG